MMAPIPYLPTTMKPKSTKERPFWQVPLIALGAGLGLSLLAVMPMLTPSQGPPPQAVQAPQPEKSPPAAQPETPAPDGTRRIKGDDRFGCASREYMDRLTKMSAQGDMAASENGIRAGFASGQCVPFIKGEPVYIEKFDWSMIEVRRPGEATTYWTFIEATE